MRYRSYTEKYEPEQVYVFTCLPCPVCKKSAVVEVKAPDLYYYNQNGSWPPDTFTPAQAELFISGTHGDCWDKLFTPTGQEKEDYRGM